MFAEKDRLIYSYQRLKPDGSVETIRRDPVTLHRQLTLAFGQHEEKMFAAMRGLDQAERLRATECFIDAVREVFGLPAIDEVTGIGMVEDEVFATYADFCDFMEKKNMNSATKRNSSPLTVSPRSPSRSLMTPTSGTC